MFSSILRLTFLVIGWYFVFPIVAHSAVCNATFGFSDPDLEPVGGLLVDVHYANAPASPIGSGAELECTGLISGGLSSFNDLSDQKTLKAGFVHLSGFGGASLFRCAFEGEPFGSDALTIETLDASTPDLERILPVPAVVVSDLDCDGPGGGCEDPSDPSCPRCGDGAVNVEAEECDDGNDDTTDACPSECNEARCGDGYHHAGHEDCDDGEANSDDQADACRSNCQLPSCGDGVTDSNEGCDDGNDNDGDGCLSDCTPNTCGDGFLDDQEEECDEGAANDDADPEACRGDCSWSERCGDADGNGLLTVTDARIILQKAIGLPGNCAKSRCDVNASATLTATDARAVLNASVGLNVELDCWLPVVFHFDNEALVAGLQFVVSYGETGSTFVGSGDGVYCTAAEGALASFNNDVDARQLHVAIVVANGIPTPAAVAACSFYQTDQGPASEDFVVDVIDATTPSLESIPEPTVSVLF